MIKKYLLVRDPSSLKMDSMHYGDKGLEDARQLQKHLASPGPGRPIGEQTQLFEIDIVRGTCASVEATHV